MNSEWVIGFYIGEQAKRILEHASAGIGYFVLDQGRQGNQATVQAALRRAIDSPTPDHLQRVTDLGMIRKLNDRYDTRHGVSDHSARVTPSPQSQATLMNIKETLNKRRHRKPTSAPVDLQGAES
jgi:hypothetical protein